MSPLRNPNTCVAPVPCQYKCYKHNFGFMSRFVGYHVFADAPQLLKVPSLTLKSSHSKAERRICMPEVQHNPSDCASTRLSSPIK